MHGAAVHRLPLREAVEIVNLSYACDLRPHRPRDGSRLHVAYRPQAEHHDVT